MVARTRSHGLALVEPADGALIGFYLERARAYGKKALELGCRSGVVAVALALSGIRVSAFDPSQTAVTRALARRRALRIQPERCRIERADLRSLRLDEGFPFVYLPSNGLLVQGSMKDVIAVLATARRHLSPGGVFVLDVHQTPRFLDVDRVRSHEEIRAALSRKPHLRARASQGHPGALHALRLLDLSREEIDDAFAHAGLKAVELWGGFDERPYQPCSERMVIVAVSGQPGRRRCASGLAGSTGSAPLEDEKPPAG